jgi:hypothetical protein
LTEWITAEDVSSWLGRELTPEEIGRLPGQIAAVQKRLVAAIGWSPFPPSSLEMVLRGTWSHRLQLPRRPVLEVSVLEVNGVHRTGWWLAPPDELIGPWAGVWGGTDGVVEIEGTFGYTSLPPDLAALTTELTAMLLTTDPQLAQGMLQSESLGPYRVAYQSMWEAAGGAWGGTSAIIARYRPSGNTSLAVSA